MAQVVRLVWASGSKRKTTWHRSTHSKAQSITQLMCKAHSRQHSADSKLAQPVQRRRLNDKHKKELRPIKQDLMLFLANQPHSVLQMKFSLFLQ